MPNNYLEHVNTKLLAVLNEKIQILHSKRKMSNLNIIYLLSAYSLFSVYILHYIV